jgi:hypothetical protein
MLKSTFLKNSKNLSIKLFSEIVPKSDTAVVKPSSLETLSEISKQTFGLTPEEYKKTKAVGADLYLSPDKKEIIQNPSFFFRDRNDGLNLENAASRGWKLKYLKNMNLLNEYDTLFRDYLQSCATYDANGLALDCEPTFQTLLQQSLNTLKKKGYQLEIESLSTKMDYGVLRIELYKNLNIDRSKNSDYSRYSFVKSSTPLGTLVNAREIGEDNNSLAKNQKPFILATTMLVRTPMKIAIFNQNLSRKIYGENENEAIDYVVRFETQMNYSDFTWILPGPNKPSRLRMTKITDFNNLARGNPFFPRNTWDLIDENARYNYMTKDRSKDEQVYFSLDLLNKFI